MPVTLFVFTAAIPAQMLTQIRYQATRALVEIELVTNFGIRLYNTDGTANPTFLNTLSYDDYTQKSIAYTTNCGDADYFYDFYMPFSEITGYIPTFTPSTPIRMVANTVISTQSVLKGPISDIGGLNDKAYNGDYTRAWTAAISGMVPTPMSTSTIGAGGNYPPVRSTSPTVNGPIASGATSVSGTSVSGAYILLYDGTNNIGSTTAVGTSWTLSGLSLFSGQSLTVKAVSGVACISAASAAVIVTNPTTAPVISGPVYNGATSVSGTSTEPAGTLITVYKGGVSVGTATVDAYGNWTLSGIAPVLATGNILTATATAPGKTVSSLSSSVTVITTPIPLTTTTQIPVITNTYLEGGASVTGTSTAPVGTSINVYIDKVLIGTTIVLAGGHGYFRV